MRRIISALLVAVLAATLLAGCNNTVSPVKLDMDNPNYTLRKSSIPPLDSSATYSNEAKEYLEKYTDVLILATKDSPADVHVFSFEGIDFVTSEESRNYVVPALSAELGEDRVVDVADLETVGIWAVPQGNSFENDLKEYWINAFENADGELEFVVDVSRNDQPLRTLRYTESANGSYTMKSDVLAQAYDGIDPVDAPTLEPGETTASKDLYFSGRLNKTGIFELPVLGGTNISMKISGSPVAGELPGGFAGSFEGVVTIDGVSLPLTLNGQGVEIPTGMVQTPSDYYIAFSQVSIANPQDKTPYMNIYFIKKDLSYVCGLSSFYKNLTYADWFETARVSADTFKSNVKTDNEKLTSLYSTVILNTYGDRKEYNNMVAVLYNMFLGVEQNYLRTNMTKQISNISKDIRNYSEAMNDSSVSRLGENGFYFFPDGRSMVVRLLSYDGVTAVAAIDFSSMVDNGYGGLYKAEYTSDGHWTLTTLQNTRIK